MKFIADWQRVLSRSISFWMQVAGALWMILPEIRYQYTGRDYDPYFAWWVGILLIVAGITGRFLQQNLRWWQEWLRLIGIIVLVIALAVLASTARASTVQAAPATEQATAIDIAVPFIAREEGEVRTAYQDIVGVWTICFGSTRGVTEGMVKTHEECMDLLRQEVAEYRDRLHRFFTDATITMRLPATRDAAYTSTAFNCGVSAIGRSTATQRLNDGNVVGGCEALTWWKRAGGRVIRGLYERRKREKALCLIGT